MRAAVPEDSNFLWKVYRSTRLDEVALFGWPPAQQDAFLEMQYRARCQSYRAAFPEAECLVLLENGVDAGSMIVARTGAEIRLVDIALFPEYRGRGLGAAAIDGLIREAAQSSMAVRLSVLCGNPAIRLYRRLGFDVISSDPMYIEMEHHAIAR